MASEVEICKVALSHIRAKSINSLTEASREAQECKLHYPIARDFVLRDNWWNFAKKVAPLALLVDEPKLWAYAYQYPSDCLNMRMVTVDNIFKDQTTDGLANRFRFQDFIPQPERGLPYEILTLNGVKIIGNDFQDAFGYYTAKVTDPNLFDVQFTDALSFLLASRLAIPLVGGDFGRKMREDMLALYNQAMSAAIVSNNNEQKRNQPRQSRFVEGRI